MSDFSIRDAADNQAYIDSRGRLTAWQSQGVQWTLPAPLPGWSAVVLEAEQERDVVPAGNPTITAHDRERIEIVFHALRCGSQIVPATTTLNWFLNDGLLQGALALKDWPETFILQALVFPDISVEYANPHSPAMVVPADTGWLIEEAPLAIADEEAHGRAVRLDHLPMQFLAWIENERGLYLDTRDTAGWMREWRIGLVRDTHVRLRCLHLMPRQRETGANFSLPYPVSLGGFRGGWYEAARIYRSWALQTPWARRGPDQRRTGFVADIACWVWNRGRAAAVVPPARELAARIGHPVALDWYWWHKHGYDTEYPDYFPPREGECRFRKAVREAQAGDLRVQIYTNGMCYDVDGQAWEPAGPECALMQADGSWFAPAYNTFTQHHLASVCGAAERWRPILFEVVRQARALGIDGLYLDMIAAVGGRRPCYHPRHGHAPGGGCYGVQGFRATLAQIRAMHPGFPLSTESCQEWYLDLFESHIICGVSLERLKWQAEQFGGRGRVIPLFSAVYHGYTVGFGNYSFLDGIPPFDELWPPEYHTAPDDEHDWVARCPDQFAIELARTVTFGLQPLVSNLHAAHFDDPRLARDLDFLVALSRFYYREREFLLWGEMLPPGTLTAPVTEVVFLQRFVFTAPGEETYLQRSFPAVLHSAWQAPDGRLAVVLVNYTREPAPLTYTPASGFRIEFADPVPCHGLHSSKTGLTGTLPPRTAVSIQLARTGATP